MPIALVLKFACKKRKVARKKQNRRKANKIINAEFKKG
ncbi:hypothetical protein pb186bvf_013921 [Paramecium bursaria]